MNEPGVPASSQADVTSNYPDENPRMPTWREEMLVPDKIIFYIQFVNLRAVFALKAIGSFF